MQPLAAMPADRQCRRNRHDRDLARQWRRAARHDRRLARGKCSSRNRRRPSRSRRRADHRHPVRAGSRLPAPRQRPARPQSSAGAMAAGSRPPRSWPMRAQARLDARGRTAAAASRCRPKAAAITALQTLGGQAVYLSDLEPVGYKHIPFLQLAWPYQADRNVSGDLLRAGGKLFLKGLGMHSASRLTYDLDRPASRLEAALAIDDSGRRPGKRRISRLRRHGRRPLGAEIHQPDRSRRRSAAADHGRRDGSQADQLAGRVCRPGRSTRLRRLARRAIDSCDTRISRRPLAGSFAAAATRCAFCRAFRTPPNACLRDASAAWEACRKPSSYPIDRSCRLASRRLGFAASGRSKAGARLGTFAGCGRLRRGRCQRLRRGAGITLTRRQPSVEPPSAWPRPA